MSIIEVTNLTKTYTTYKRGSDGKSAFRNLFIRTPVLVNAVDNISFQIEEGEICGILGPNGAGKSTTIKMLCGSLFPTSGTITVMNYLPYKDRQKYVKYIGAVFGQKSQLIFDIPPLDSFRMNKAIYGISKTDFQKRLSMMTELFDLQDITNKPTRVLSLGERMKCEFIMAMLHHPKIVFLDEPTIGLDVVAKAKIREFVKEMNANGTTFILTTHDLEDVEQLADRVIIVNHGKKVFDDDLPSLKGSLGDKKRIDLVLTKPFKAIELPFARVMEQSSSQEITLEIDMTGREISQVIEQMSRSLPFSDISIRELPMEEIITKIYTK